MVRARCQNVGVNRATATWIVTALFGGLLVLQAVRFGAMKLPVHLPLVLLVTTGLVAGLFPFLKPLQTRLMFVSAYGTAFIWVWATGQPASGLGIGRFWLATTVLLVAILAVLTFVQSQSQTSGKKWSWTFLLAVAFGLFVAFVSGPGGEADWLSELVWNVSGLDRSEWRTHIKIVFYIRKSIHFLVYGSAAFVTAWAIWKQGGKLPVCLAAGYGWPLPLAIFDEWNQSHVESRTGTPWDVMIDLFGMTVFLGVFAWIYKRKETKDLEAKL